VVLKKAWYEQQHVEHINKMENKTTCQCGQTQDPNGNCDGSHLLKK